MRTVNIKMFFRGTEFCTDFFRGKKREKNYIGNFRLYKKKKRYLKKGSFSTWFGESYHVLKLANGLWQKNLSIVLDMCCPDFTK